MSETIKKITKKISTESVEETVSETNSEPMKGQDNEISSIQMEEQIKSEEIENIAEIMSALGIKDILNNIWKKPAKMIGIRNIRTALKRKTVYSEELRDRVIAVGQLVARGISKEKLNNIATKMADLENNDISIYLSVPSLIISLIACFVSILISMNSIETELVAIALIALIAIMGVMVIPGLILSIGAKKRQTSCIKTAIAVELLDLLPTDNATDGSDSKENDDNNKEDSNKSS